MEETKFDDMLMEMITPQVIEIEEKFGRGQGLNQGDINTLLLKSQYNHINHLDRKLNDVTADVASLKGEFTELRGEFTELKSEFKTFKAEIKADLAEFKTDIQVTINETMKWYIGGAGIVIIALKTLDIFIK